MYYKIKNLECQPKKNECLRTFPFLLLLLPQKPLFFSHFSIFPKSFGVKLTVLESNHAEKASAQGGSGWQGTSLPHQIRANSPLFPQLMNKKAPSRRKPYRISRYSGRTGRVAVHRSVRASLREGGGTAKAVTEGACVILDLLYFIVYAFSSTASRSPLPEGALQW